MFLGNIAVRVLTVFVRIRFVLLLLFYNEGKRYLRGRPVMAQGGIIASGVFQGFLPQ